MAISKGIFGKKVIHELQSYTWGKSKSIVNQWLFLLPFTLLFKKEKKHEASTGLVDLN